MLERFQPELGKVDPMSTMTRSEVDSVKQPQAIMDVA